MTGIVNPSRVGEDAGHHLDVGPAQSGLAAGHEHVVGTDGGRVDLPVRDLMWSLDHDRLHRATILRTVSATGDLARRFSSLYTGALTDVLDRHGYLQQTLGADIAPLRPGMRLAGPVYPVLGRPRPGHDYDTSIRRILEMLGSVPSGSVAVYETNERSAAHFGELSATSLASRGCAGAVLDGGARDAEYILREDFPVF